MTEDRPDPATPGRRRRGPGRAARTGLAAGLLLGLLGSVWALATPPFAAPDEPSHAVRAVATWTGDTAGRELRVAAGDAGTVTIKSYRVPSPWDTAQAIAVCNAFQPDVPAGCGPDFDASGRERSATSTAGFYPALFYVAVGWPAAVADGAAGLYLMRLVHVLWCALLVGAAAWALARRRGSPALVGVALACTPMVAFLAGTVNSSGLEIAAALCLWAALVALLDPPAPGCPHRWGEASLVVVSGLVLCFTRTFSPGYAAVICGIALVAAPGVGPRTLLRRRDVLVALGVLAVGAAVATLLIVRSGQFDTPATSGSPLGRGDTPLSVGLGFQELSFRQMVAVFGWLDTGTAQLAYYAWVVAWGALAAGAVALGAWRRSLGVALAVAAAVALPIAANWGQADTAGFVWQGRYSLPFAVGLPLLAAVAWDESRDLPRGVRRRSVVLLACLTAVGQVYALYWALRRSAVGLDGELVFFGAADWSPPLLGTVGAMVATVAVSAAMVVLLARAPAVVGGTAPGPDVATMPPAVRDEGAHP